MLIQFRYSLSRRVMPPFSLLALLLAVSSVIPVPTQNAAAKLRSTLITASSLKVTHPVVSDNSRIAFSSDRDGNLEI
jgi:hypothetical protein